MEEVEEDTFVVEVAVNNTGVRTLTGVQLIEQLLDGVEVVEDSFDQPTCAKTSTSITCGLGSILRGRSATVNFTVQIDDANPLLGRTIVRSNETGDVALNDPYVVKVVAPPFARPGDVVTWTIFLINPGDETATNVTVRDTLPDSLEILAASATTGQVTAARGQVDYRAASLAPIEAVTITVTTRVRANVPADPVIYNRVCLTSSEDSTPKCVSAPLFRVTNLPVTGESPWWAKGVWVGSGVTLILAGAWLTKRLLLRL